MKDQPRPEDFLDPQNDAEKQEAARAIYIERRRVESDALVESLTERERLLIDSAWRAGASAVRDDLHKRLTSPLAVTLDAVAVREALNRNARQPLAAPPFQPWSGGHYDDRLADLVRGVDEILEYAALRRAEVAKQDAA